jgi:pimeloyl-ACP methyl ester carboxylesterase
MMKADLAPIEEGRARSNGVGIAWKRYGSGDPTVLFVPTWNLVDARVSRHQVSFLEPQATVITYDPRGAGASDRPSSGYDFVDHAADAMAVLDDTGTERAVVITASRGINSAVLLAARHPDRIQTLVAVAPFMDFDAPEGEQFWLELDRYEGWDKYNAAYWRRDWPDFARFFMGQVFTEPDSEATIEELVGIALDASPEVLIQQEREQDWTVAPPLLGSVACPTLLIHGDDDRTTPLVIAETIAMGIPDARLVVLAGAGHRPDVSSPEIVNPLLGEFLEPLGAQG